MKCTICGKEFFAKGREQYCSKECKAIRRRQYSKKYKENNLEKVRERDKQQKLMKYHKQKNWNHDSRKCIYCGAEFFAKQLRSKYCSRKCKNLDYARNNPSYWKKFNKEKVIDKDISLKRLYEKYNGICYLCGEMCDWDSKNENGRPSLRYPSIDHVIPRARGGTHSWDNVRLAHISCNCKKQDYLIG